MTVWILPAVIIVGWILSWWGRPRIRWGMLSAAAVTSLLCLAIGFFLPARPISPDSACNAGQVQCMDMRPVDWLVTGGIGLGFCVALLLLTLMGELIIEFRRKPPSQASSDK